MTIERFEERMTRLYEQGADASRIGAYARHWWRWVQAGVTLMDEVLAERGQSGTYWSGPRISQDGTYHFLGELSTG